MPNLPNCLLSSQASFCLRTSPLHGRYRRHTRGSAPNVENTEKERDRQTDLFFTTPDEPTWTHIECRPKTRIIQGVFSCNVHRCLWVVWHLAKACISYLLVLPPMNTRPSLRVALSGNRRLAFCGLGLSWRRSLPLGYRLCALPHDVFVCPHHCSNTLGCGCSFERWHCPYPIGRARPGRVSPCLKFARPP